MHHRRHRGGGREAGSPSSCKVWASAAHSTNITYKTSRQQDNTINTNTSIHHYNNTTIQQHINTINYINQPIHQSLNYHIQPYINYIHQPIHQAINKLHKSINYHTSSINQLPSINQSINYINPSININQSITIYSPESINKTTRQQNNQQDNTTARRWHISVCVVTARAISIGYCPCPSVTVAAEAALPQSCSGTAGP
jgi:hypothetical protein